MRIGGMGGSQIIYRIVNRTTHQNRREWERRASDMENATGNKKRGRRVCLSLLPVFLFLGSLFGKSLLLGSFVRAEELWEEEVSLSSQEEASSEEILLTSEEELAEADEVVMEPLSIGELEERLSKAYATPSPDFSSQEESVPDQMVTGEEFSSEASGEKAFESPEAALGEEGELFPKSVFDLGMFSDSEIFSSDAGEFSFEAAEAEEGEEEDLGLFSSKAPLGDFQEKENLELEEPAFAADWEAGESTKSASESSQQVETIDLEEEEYEEIPEATPIPSYDFTPSVLNSVCQVEEEKRLVTLKIQEGQDVTDAMNYGLSYVKTRGSEGKSWTLVVPPGSYQLSGTLFMYSYTHLKAVGATLTKVSATKHILLRLGSSQDEGKGFDTYRDVTIEGGTWDCNYESLSEEKREAYGGTVGFRLGHVTNLVIRDCTIKNTVQGHLIELGGVKNAEICGCTLTGYWKGHQIRNQEAIQLDVVLKATFPGYLPYDGLSCENVNIHDNRIVDNMSGIGFHSMVPAHPYKGIRIHDNYFSDISRRAVSVANLESGEIYSNVFERVYIGVQVTSITGSIHFMSSKEAISPRDLSCELSIQNNRISLYEKGAVQDKERISYGILLTGDVYDSSDMIVNGQVKDGVYGLSKVKVLNNEIQGGEAGIRLRLCTDCEVSGNTVIGSWESGIFLNGSMNCQILHNLVRESTLYGIYLNKASGSSRVSSYNLLEGNILEGSGKFGVYLKGAYPENTFSANTIRLSKDTGIYGTKVKGVNLSQNVLQGNQGDGILFLNSSKMKLEGNQITANTGSGIVLASCSVKTLNENEVGHNGGYGFHVKDTQIKKMKKNLITANEIWQKNSTGIKTLKLSCSTKDSGGKTIIQGQAKGLKKVSVWQGDVFLCEGKVSKNKYSLKAEELGGGQLLVILGKDSMGNQLRLEAVTD